MTGSCIDPPDKDDFHKFGPANHFQDSVGSHQEGGRQSRPIATNGYFERLFKIIFISRSSIVITPLDNGISSDWRRTMMQEEKATVLKKEDAVADMMMTDDHNYKALISARDGLATAQTTRPLSRIDSLERQLSRNVRDYGKWVDTQIETYQQQIAQHESVNKQLAAQISELKAAVVSKEAALVVAQSDLKKAQDDLRLKNSTSSLNALGGTNAELRDQLQIAAPLRDGMIAAGSDPRLKRGNQSRGRPNTPRGAPRGRVEKR